MLHTGISLQHPGISQVHPGILLVEQVQHRGVKVASPIKITAVPGVLQQVCSNKPCNVGGNIVVIYVGGGTVVSEQQLIVQSTEKVEICVYSCWEVIRVMNYFFMAQIELFCANRVHFSVIYICTRI